jgi:5-methylcytosine-specific restriction protein B
MIAGRLYLIMVNSSDESYTVEDAKNEIEILQRVPEDVVEGIRTAEDEKVLEYLIETEELDKIHDGERGLGQIRRAVLKSPVASDRLKRVVSYRGDETPEDILVPQSVERNAKVVFPVPVGP